MIKPLGLEIDPAANRRLTVAVRDTRVILRRMNPSLLVYFDGSCPMCVREVAAYRRQSPADIVWNNLAEPGLSIPCDGRGYRPEPESLMRRFHVFTDDGRWLSGAPAFALLWSRLGAPWRVLAAIGRLPGGLWLMDSVYALFLRLRPSMQRIAHQLVVPEVLPVVMIPALRSDHAGETGAVWIYRAMRLLNRDASLGPLIEEHRAQEMQHLEAFNRLLPWRCRSRLLPLWRLAGAMTGAVAALGGRRWTLATIAAVERFVDRHYLEQIEQLDALLGVHPGSADRVGLREPDAALDCASGMCEADQAAGIVNSPEELLKLLIAFRQDECRHRDDALRALADSAKRDTTQRPGLSGRLLAHWCDAVERGSAIAVKAAKAL